jgi:hypothetical protein
VLAQKGVHASGKPSDVSRLSLAELAKTELVPLLETVIVEQASLPASLPPTDPRIRPYRKHLERLRNHLDLFASVYPAQGKTDDWEELRHRIDVLYESMGSLKDLWDSQLPTAKPGQPVAVDPDLLGKRQEKLNQASEKLLRPKNLTKYRALLCAPETRPGQERSPKGQSRFSWGGVELRPDLTRPGIDNLRALVRAQATRALEDYEQLCSLGDVATPKHEKQLHDFRKRVRTLLNVSIYFPEVFRQPDKGTATLRPLYGLITQYGLVIDQLAGMHVDEDEQRTDALGVDAHRIDDAWSSLNTWQQKLRVPALLGELIASL